MKTVTWPRSWSKKAARYLLVPQRASPWPFDSFQSHVQLLCASKALKTDENSILWDSILQDPWTKTRLKDAKATKPSQRKVNSMRKAVAVLVWSHWPHLRKSWLLKYCDTHNIPWHFAASAHLLARPQALNAEFTPLQPNHVAQNKMKASETHGEYENKRVEFNCCTSKNTYTLKETSRMLAENKLVVSAIAHFEILQLKQSCLLYARKSFFAGSFDQVSEKNIL